MTRLHCTYVYDETSRSPMSTPLVQPLQLMTISSNVTMSTHGRDNSLGRPNECTHKHS